ncbi:MAG: gliding motility-associated C-terminal domain-containing protein, partial [Flavobacteriales bacterium]
VAGCDSVITLDLTINSFASGTDVQSACGSFTWIDGVTYTSSTNTPTFTIPGGSVAGCDSVITLDLTINSFASGTDVQSACGSFTWIDGVTYTASTNTPTFTIPGGSAAGCDSVITLNLTVNSNSSANLNATICEGETFELNGSSFSQSGVFNITISNASGCDSIVTLNLLVNPIAQQNINEQICDGESFLFDGNEYSSSGTYVAQFTGSNGCDSLVTLNLLVVAPAAETINAAICEGQSLVIEGNSFSSAGTYFINTTSASGCDSLITLNLVVNTATSSLSQVSICEGSSYTFNGNVYTQTGIYTSTLINSAGCDSIATLELTVNGSIQINQQASICQGDAFTLPDGSTVNASGVYTVTLTAAAGCDSVVVTTLTVLDAINQNISASICQGESFILPNGLEVSQAGVYTSTFTSSLGCDSIITVTISIQDAVQIGLSAENDILSICHGTSTTLTATGASNYTWSPSESLSESTGENVIANPEETTTYLVTGTIGACSGTAEITITVLPAPALIANPEINTICFGESVQLNVSGAESYIWSPAIDLSCFDCPNPIATPTETIIYQAIGSLGSCIDTIDVLVNVISVTASIVGDTSVCFNDSITLTAFGGDTYIWSTGDTTSQTTIAPLQSGYHYVLVNVGGCIDSSAIFIHVRPFPFIDAGNDTTIYPGGSVPIMVEGGGYISLSWNPFNTLSCGNCPNPIATPDVSTTYCVTAVNVFGCAITDCIKISIDSICGNLFVPNVFSPVEGGHRENDCFRVYGTDCVASMELSVYNRWGEKVFETNKIDDCWDGTFRGKELNSAVFVYQLKAKLHSGETIAKQGNVTLLR